MKTKNTMIFILVVIFFTISLSNYLKINEKSIETNSLSCLPIYELYKRDSNIVFIDLRTIEEYERLHIKSAINIPYTLRWKYKKILPIKYITNNNFKIFLYCGNKMCGLSQKALEFFKSNGMSNIFIISGGFNCWVNNGYPVESSNKQY